ncbi:MAG: alanine racemase [Synechococcales cyanobacterium]
MVMTRARPSVSTLSQQRRAWVEVSATALRHNLHHLRQGLHPQTQLWAVVKANAYGHGATLVATLLAAGDEAAVEGFCVATLEEGIELRQAGLTHPIVILEGLHQLQDWQTAHAFQLQVSLTDLDQLSWVEAVPGIPFHVHVDTGMTRLGIPWSEVSRIWPQVMASGRCVSLYSHLATAETPDHPAFALQVQRFRQLITQLQSQGWSLPPIHLGNSAIALGCPALHYDRVRVGLALYGMAPDAHLDGEASLRPVMQVCAKIVQIYDVAPGTGVSYGQRFVTQRPSRIATVGLGYADGLPRRLSGQIEGSLHGQIVPQVGTITMDLSMWDVTEVPAAVGDVIRLWDGPDSAVTWAEQLDTIPYEILCGLGARLPRVLVP